MDPLNKLIELNVIEVLTSFQSCVFANKIIFREKYEHTKINFRSIADLRRNLQSHHGYEDSLVTLSTLELIKTYIESKENANGNKKEDVSVRFMCYVR